MSATAGIERAEAAEEPQKPKRRRRRWFAWTVVTLLAVWAVTRVGGLESGSFPTQLMTVTPFGAALAALTALLSLLRRNRPAALAAALVCAVMVAVVVPRTISAEQPAAKGAPLRVLTINLFGRADAEAVVDHIRTHDVEVFSALELTYAEAERLDEAGLKELLPYRVLQPELDVTGGGIYAKYPLTELHGLFTPIGHNMPAARVALPGGESVEIVAVHPNPPLGRRVEEWNTVLRTLPSASPSAVRVLAGDFNASLDHRAFRDLLDRGYVDAARQVGKGLVPTWPNFGPMRPFISIDHVLADRRVAVERVEVLDVPGTDHRGVFAALRLP
ncbi:endonuclease/exonuclease/phosphatase family protein [Nonomuraea aridisoli]|uniref:Endonuclease/exonuclease/phosphatase family protein n=1 Tax=Nonomuraea aridisoli TaxID=2070368 RepID=A0A2W2ECM8_9ACTN|nr:endonuclease/exonuclease/phosphatase family protein [Nonomuraea aridisoli]PZG20251.1 endonuclease/exonuclease/phosphatase family protein [Nonomuraea aridisoli]